VAEVLKHRFRFRGKWRKQTVTNIAYGLVAVGAEFNPAAVMSENGDGGI